MDAATIRHCQQDPARRRSPRRRTRRRAALGALAPTTIGFGGAAAPPPAAPSPAYATAVAGARALPADAAAAQTNVQRLVNSRRRSRGLAPLAVDAPPPNRP